MTYADIRFVMHAAVEPWIGNTDNIECKSMEPLL